MSISIDELERRIKDLEIGGQPVKVLERELRDNGINITNDALWMLREECPTRKDPKVIKVVRLQVRELGLFERRNSLHQIDLAARQYVTGGQRMGLGPAEVGPRYRLKYAKQPRNGRLVVAMKSIADPIGFPRVFLLTCPGGVLQLDSCYEWGDDLWRPDDEFIFSFRKLKF